MGTTLRRIRTSVIEKLRKEPWRFEFFEAVRILRLSHKHDLEGSNKTLAPLSRFVTYRTHLSLNFPASEIQDLDIEDDVAGGTPTKPPAMTVNFMGLIGPSGVLPRHYTEFLLARRMRHKDETAHRFFDLFNHRAISLFVEAWEKYRFHIGYERGHSRNTMRYLLDLVGMGTTGLQGRLEQADGGIKDEMLAYYSGLNAQRPHSSVALAAILQDYFKVSVAILQFQGRWLRLEPEQYSRLGKRGAFQVLGKSAVLGEFVWDHQAKFRVRIGPVNKITFDDFLPIGKGFMALKKYVDWYKAMGQNYDVQLVLRKEEVPACCLGDHGSARLGWSTWLKHRPFGQDADDTVLSC